MFACLYKPDQPREHGGRPPFSPDAEKTGSDPASGSRLLDVARLFSPRVDARSETVVTLEVDGLTRLFGDHKTIGDQLRRAAVDAGLGSVHVAVATTRTTAILCAAARAGVTVVPAGDEAAFLALLPLRMLEVFLPDPACPAEAGRQAVWRRRESRLPRASSRSRESRGTPTPDTRVLSVLSRWGIRTLGQFAALPAVELSERIGQEGLAWQRLARGDDTGPLVSTREEDPFEATVDLEWPVESLEPLSFVLSGLLDPLCQRLERRDRGAAVLHLHLRLVTKDTHSRSLQLPAPMRDAKVLRTLLLLDLESHQASAGVDRVTVTIDPTPGRIVQESLLTRALPAPEQVSTLLARLGALMGDTRCGSPALVDTHRPGAFAMTPFRVPESPVATAKVGARPPSPSELRRASACQGSSPLRDSPGSPTLLTELRRGHVVAPRAEADAASACQGSSPLRDSPVSPRSPTACLRRFRLPIPARVLIDHNRPVVVKTDRPGLSGGHVHACAGPWRTSGEWWKTSTAQGMSGMEALRGLTGWNRDEWDVSLGDGGLYRIFEDRESGRWFVEAVVD